MWKRRVAIGMGAVTLGFAVVVALLPMLLSSKLGCDLVAHFAAPYVHGKVAIADMALSWTGPQVIRGLSLTGADGASIVVDVTAANGVLALARQSEGPRITLGGAITTIYRPDGSLSVAELFVPRGTAATVPEPPATKPSAAAAHSQSLAKTLEGLVVEITGLTVTATSSESGRVDALRDLKGTCAVENSGIRADFAATTQVGEKRGSFSIRGALDHLLADDGSINFTDAAIDLDLQATEFALPSTANAFEVPALSLKITAQRLASELSVEGTTTIQVPTGESAKVVIDVVAKSPLEPAESSYSGTVAIDALPTSALARWLPAQVNALRDIGASLSMSASLAGRTGQIEIKSTALQLQVRGELDSTGSLLTLSALELRAMIDPALMPAAARAVAPTTIGLTATQVTVPLGLRKDSTRWKQVRGELDLTISPMNITLATADAQPPMKCAIGATHLRLQSGDFTSGVAVSLTSSVDGASIAVDQVFSSLVGPDGFAPKSAAAKGSITLGALPLADAQWLAPATRTALAECALSTLAGRVDFDATAIAGTASAALQFSDTSVAVKGAWNEQTLSTNSFTIALLVSPALAQKYLPETVALASPLALAVRVDPLTVKWDAINAGHTLPEQSKIALTSPLVEIARAPGLTRAAQLHDVSIGVTLKSRADGTLGGIQAAVSTKILDRGRAAGGLAATFAMNDFAVDSWQSTLDLTVESGETLVQMVDAKAASVMLAGPGRVQASLNRAGASDAFTAKVALPRLTLNTSGNRSATAIVLAATTATFDLPAALIANSEGSSLIGSLAIESLRWTGNADDAAVVMSAVIEPGSFTAPGRDPIAFEQIKVQVSSPHLAEHAMGSVTGNFAVGKAAPSALAITIEAKGNLRSLFGAADAPLTLHDSAVRLQAPGPLVLALWDWSSGASDAASALTRVGEVKTTLAIKSLALSSSGIASAAVDATLTLDALDVQPKGKPPVSIGATSVSVQSPRLADSIALTIASGGPHGGTFAANASGVRLVNSAGEFDPLAAAWTVHAQARGVTTALVDAMAGQGGQMVEALGPTLDATVDTTLVTNAAGAQDTRIAATLTSQFLDVDAPSVLISNGKAIVTAAIPLRVTFTINPVLQRRLLEPLNPVLADIHSAPPIVLSVSQVSYPLDGKLATLDLDARIQVGDVQIVRSNQVLGVLLLAQQCKSETIPAQVQPLVITVRAGQLKYADFIVRAGKFGDQWQQTLKLSGDIDLTHTPPYANAITCRYPLASLARSVGGAAGGLSGTMTQLSEAIAALPIDPGELVQADITLSGPLGEVNGKKVPLASNVKLVFDASSLDAKHIEKGIRDIGGTIDKIKGLFGK